jgi:threonine aldolase
MNALTYPNHLKQHFASDNYAGMCGPAAHWFLEANNSGHAPAYGDDEWTQKVSESLRNLFQTDCDIYFVFNGTAANSLALASLCQSYHSVVCSPVAHIETDECGGPEFFSNGSKLLVADAGGEAGQHGKLTPDAIEAIVTKRTDLHATELGTIYSVEEVRAIAAIAKRRHLKLHMDGARFANAVATLGCHPSEITWRAGVDVLCFGGTKNGLPVGEAVVFFDKHLSEDFAYRVKQAGQLASKMRFISAPWLGMLQDDVWLSNARHANAMAQRLRSKLEILEGLSLLAPTQANGVFVNLPQTAIDKLQTGGWRFYEFIAGGGCRFMCSWDTTDEAVDALVSAIEASLN